MSCGMAAFVEGLRAEVLATLSSLLPIEKPFALVDVPNHSNVGDSAIYLGELAWMREAGLPQPDYVCDIYSYDESALRAKVPRGTIFVHGGGNLGDLWKAQQEFRERIVAAFPSHRVIQLPQTIHFESPAALEKAAELFSAHQNLTIIARDRVSLRIAREDLRCRKTLLCPDSAFALGPMDRPSQPTDDVVMLVRSDKESARRPLPAGISPVDWIGDQTTPRLRVERFLRRHRMGLKLRTRLRRPLAQERLMRGCRVLSRGREVATDRLHAHILCLLMGIPHVLVDNNYGKLSSFFDAWTRNAPGVRFCSDWSEVDSALRALRG
jgi:exopolysaccharide biosynthesis predicted pyruvyltransferase EpsI